MDERLERIPVQPSLDGKAGTFSNGINPVIEADQEKRQLRAVLDGIQQFVSLWLFSSNYSGRVTGDSDYSNTTLYTGRTFDPAIGLYYYGHRICGVA